MKTFSELLYEAQKPLGKFIDIVNGYPIHDLGAKTKFPKKRFLVYEPGYFYIQSTAPTMREAGKKAIALTPGVKSKKPSKEEQDHQDWLDKQKHRIQSGEVRRAVRGY